MVSSLVLKLSLTIVTSIFDMSSSVINSGAAIDDVGFFFVVDLVYISIVRDDVSVDKANKIARASPSPVIETHIPKRANLWMA